MLRYTCWSGCVKLMWRVSLQCNNIKMVYLLYSVTLGYLSEPSCLFVCLRVSDCTWGKKKKWKNVNMGKKKISHKSEWVSRRPWAFKAIFTILNWFTEKTKIDSKRLEVYWLVVGVFLFLHTHTYIQTISYESMPNLIHAHFLRLLTCLSFTPQFQQHTHMFVIYLGVTKSHYHVFSQSV